MLPLLLLVLTPLPAVYALEPTHGVPPALLTRYSSANSGKWKCLDGSKDIPWSSVNDDYCDCPDGSDEPGTSACPNTTFYCVNKGHMGSSIPSSRVDDGLCEPDCCDGSDEQPGMCPNLCEEIGVEYRAKRDAARKIQKTGSKIRSTYLAFAQKEKLRMEERIESSTREIASKEKDVARLKDLADRTESISAAALEHKQQSPLYTSLIKHSNALKSLQREHKKHLEREQALGAILVALRGGYNPNYQDMAVLEAVRGWEELAGLKHIGIEEDAAGEEAEEEASDAVEEVLPAGMWTKEMLEKDVDVLVDSDYVSLLLQHDEHIGATTHQSILFDLESYIPDALMPQYQDTKDALVSWLKTLGVIHSLIDNSGETAKARQALTDAENALKSVTEEKRIAKADYEDLFDIEGFGREGEWKKLDGTCLSKEYGDYEYEICLFDEAKQKPLHGGSTFSLGKWDGWNDAATPGTPEYYTKQVYKRGTKCWNGPDRQVTFVITCGVENAIHTVAELEKCEYQFTGTSPALCLPLEPFKEEHEIKDEL